MPRMIELKSGNTLQIAGPARVIVYGAPTLTPPSLFAAAGGEQTPQTKEEKSHGHSQQR